MSFVNLSTAVTFGGAYVAYKGLKNWHAGNSMGKYQVVFGALAMIGGIHLSMSQTSTFNIPTFDDFLPSDCKKTMTAEKIKEYCENAFKDGKLFSNQFCPAGDLKKYIKDVVGTIGEEISFLTDKSIKVAECHVELTTEGHQLYHSLAKYQFEPNFSKKIADGFNANFSERCERFVRVYFS